MATALERCGLTIAAQISYGGDRPNYYPAIVTVELLQPNEVVAANLAAKAQRDEAQARVEAEKRELQRANPPQL